VRETAHQSKGAEADELADLELRLRRVAEGKGGCHVSVPWDKARQKPRPWSPAARDGIAVHLNALVRAGVIRGARARLGK
jgi:hypothetical protein